MENNGFKNEFNENEENTVPVSENSENNEYSTENTAENPIETYEENFDIAIEDNSISDANNEDAGDDFSDIPEVTAEIKDDIEDDWNMGYGSDADFIPPVKKSGRMKIVKKVALIAAIALVAGAVFGAATAVTNKFVASKFKFSTTEAIMSKSNGNVEAEGDIATIAESCMPSIVTITNMSVSDVVTFFGTYAQESKSSGSGIVIGKNDTELLVVTNHHVIANSKELKVIFSHNEYDNSSQSADEEQKNSFTAQVKGYNADKDLAVIAVKLSDISDDAMSRIAIATIGDSSKMRPGDRVVAIGNALGYGQSVTTGIISAVDRELAMEGENSEQVKNKFIQTDAAINPGNSGGALLNMRGELIGINSVKIASNGVEGMGYAIPITDVEEIIGELMIQETRELVEDESIRGYLGISGRDVSPSVSQMYGIPVGVYVESVEEGLAADKAGIKPGYIITKFDNATVSTIAQLQDKLKYYRRGEKTTVTVKVMGEGEYSEKTLDITLSARKDSKAED